MTPERSPERDAAITALLPHVAGEGWTSEALVRAAGPDADLLFPGGASDLVEAYCDLADRWMEQSATAAGLLEMRVPDRVRSVIALRLHRNQPYKAAVRRAVGVLGRPRNAAVGIRCTARTVSAIWYAAGDRSSGFDWYSKRAILTGVYTATLAFWLQDADETGAASLQFLDRRLNDVAQLGRVRRRILPLTTTSTNSGPSVVPVSPSGFRADPSPK